MPTENSPTPDQGASQLAPGNYYGTCGGKPALAREISVGSWQVKVFDPTNRLALHDGWLLVGTGWATLADACAATGLS